MKFGETLYQRSIPKWAAYNLNYNELKQLIKLRTTSGDPSPVPIPGQTTHRWSLLEDELFSILKEQYDNIGLFLRSKYGEIERRLAYLDKLVRSAKRSANLYSARSTLQARRFQRLIQEAESIGEDIEALSRFAALQKTAFRKILKKYRKWTESDHLRQRLEVEVFSDGQLDLNLSEQMQHLTVQTSIIRGLETTLMYPMVPNSLHQQSSSQLESPITEITKASKLGPLHFDAAIASTPFGEAAGIAYFWVHNDNLEEARVLLLRHVKVLQLSGDLSRQSSSDTLTSTGTASNVEPSTRTCYIDNYHRYLKDTSSHSPSRIAMAARWSEGKKALVTMSDMVPRSDGCTTLALKRKDLAVALDRSKPFPKDRSASAANLSTVKDFLSQHRDLKPLCEMHCTRSRFVGINNSTEVGTFAVLHTNITFKPFKADEIASSTSSTTGKQEFPHAVLEIRWEFGRKPEVVRVFDTTHLAERVADFTLEAAAIHAQHPELAEPSWATLLDQDIRKVPVLTKVSKKSDLSTGTASGPSSTGDSVFSKVNDQSAGSETSPVASAAEFTLSREGSKSLDPKQKKARILAESPKRKGVRYYSEYDDPESELNQQEAYTIYVDPDAEAPGVETMKKIASVFSSIWHQLWAVTRTNYKITHERAPLLNDRSSQDDEDQSSGSDTDSLIQNGKLKPQYKGLQGHIRPAERYRLRLSRRQRAFERTLAQIYSVLAAMSYIFLLMSAILLTTGRRKESLPVDIGATVGVAMAMVCMTLSIVLVNMRKEPLSRFEKLTLTLADGIAVLLSAAIVVGIVRRANYRK